MDLRAIHAEPSAAERAAVDALLGAPPSEPPRAVAEVKSSRHLLLPALHAAQARVGFISPGALGYICRRLGVPPAEGYGVATFYALFSLTERPPIIAHVCDDIACKARGADELAAALEARLGPALRPGDARAASGAPPADMRAAPQASARAPSAWMKSPCLGMCERAPAAMLVAAGAAPFERSWGHATPSSVAEALVDRRAATAPERTVLPQAGEAGLRLLRRVGVVNPTSLDDYRAHGGYAALRRAFDLGPSAIIREITEAKLVGRGGAAFPTGRKWDAVARATNRPHYLVCNADESEPGTFKDRVLMEDDPFALVEAMTIAGFATGAERGFIYVRGEYPLAGERLRGAIDKARSRGLLGPNVMGKGVAFDIELRRGAGAYICGEETALFNSLEGFRGEPRNKPPFPVNVGLFGKPTCVNNVETLVNALDIVLEGAAAYAARGTAGSAGTRLFCVSGNVARPGLYEFPFGVRLSEVLARAGGVPVGRELRAVLLGGAAGTFVAPKDLDLPLTFEDTRRAGATLGSGVVMVFDDTVPLLPILQRIAAFFRDESCGQCVPCRVGTVRQEELLGRMVRGRPLGSRGRELTLLRELGQAMRDASICGLGQTASSAIESAVANLDAFGGPAK